MNRLASVDALRGLVMIVMALDHVRDFFHRAAMSSQPTDLRVASAAVFLTRWVTHICAPVFMLTAGLGAYFYWRRGNGRAADGFSRRVRPRPVGHVRDLDCRGRRALPGVRVAVASQGAKA